MRTSCNNLASSSLASELRAWGIRPAVSCSFARFKGAASRGNSDSKSSPEVEIEAPDKRAAGASTVSRLQWPLSNLVEPIDICMHPQFPDATLVRFQNALATPQR